MLLGTEKKVAIEENFAPNISLKFFFLVVLVGWGYLFKHVFAKKNTTSPAVTLIIDRPSEST